MSTNGTHTSTSSEATSGALYQRPPVDPQSVDERLEKLRETIRTWDWRAGLAEVGAAPPLEALETATPPSETLGAAAAPLITTIPADTHSSSDVVAGDESLADGSDGAKPVDVSAGPGPEATASPPMEAVAFPAAIEGLPLTDGLPLEESVFAPPTSPAPPRSAPAPPVPAFSPSDPVAPLTGIAPPTPPETALPREAAETPPSAVVGPATETVAVATGAVASSAQVDIPAPATDDKADGIGTSWFGQEPEPAREPDGAVRRLWSHPWAKLALAAVAAVVVVALVVGGIRFFKKNTTSNGTTTTTVARPTSHAVQHAPVAPISASQLATYEGFASSFQNANVTATKALVKAGGTPTTSQVVLVVVAYRTAVNLYNYQLHFIQWPQSMQSAIETDHAQLQALGSFLEAFSSVAPNGVPAWLSQLNDRANSTQVADNAVRQALGLAPSSDFP